MVADTWNTAEPHFGGNPAAQVRLLDSKIIFSREDHLDQLAAIRASIHSPNIVQSRRRRRPAFAGDDEYPPSQGPSPQAAATKKMKHIMKSTAYSGKSAKANSSREDGGFTSAFKGVTKHKATGRFEAHFWDASYERPVTEEFTGRKKPRKKGRQVYLGGFETEVEAAMAYDMAAITFLGDKAQLNYERETYADWVNGSVGKTTEQVVKEIKAQSLASRAAKKRAQKDIDGVDQASGGSDAPNACEVSNCDAGQKKTKPAKRTGMRKKVAAKHKNGSSSRAAVAPGFESPQFLPYSETKIRRRSGGMMPANELLLANTAMARQHGQLHNQSLAHHSGHPNGVQRGSGNGVDTEAQFKSPNEQFSFNTLRRGAPAPSPIPISTALKQHFNSLPQLPMPASVGPFQGYGACETPIGTVEKASGHATVTFDASGNIKGWMEKSNDQNFDVLQLSPISKGLQLSPEFTQRGIAISPARPGLSAPFWDLSSAEMSIATFLGTEHQGGLPPHSSPGGPRTVQVSNPVIR